MVRFPALSRDIFFGLYGLQPNSGAHPASCSVGTGVMRLGPVSDHHLPPPSNFEIRTSWRCIPLPSMPAHLGAGINTGTTLSLLVHCMVSLLPTGCHLFHTSICPFLTAFSVVSSILFQIQELHELLHHVKVAVMRTFPSRSPSPSPN